MATDRRLPLEVGRLTGIRDEDLRNAPSLDAALTRLEAFLGDAWIVGHNVGFDLSFLVAAGARAERVSLDTAELAACLLPTAPSYALQRLVADLRRAEARAHRALDDAEAAALLCCALRGTALGLEVRTLEGAVQFEEWLGEGISWFLREALAVKARDPFAGAPAPRAHDGQALARPEWEGAAGPTLSAAPLARAPRAGAVSRGGVESAQPPLGRPPEAGGASAGRGGPAPEGDARRGRGFAERPLADLFAPDGPLARAFERFEERAQQLEMAEAVERTLLEGGALLVEAGAGTGKSLAYLVPALRAASRGRQVLVSTHTTTLQDQLVYRDLPQLLAALEASLSVAVLKGRANYLCPRRWHLFRLGVGSREEARLAVKALVWREWTETGDRAELTMTSGEEPLWSRLCAEDETCTARRCAMVPGGCYLERARASAERADIVVVNHALLLSDARAQHSLLPNAPNVILDEAHHLEEVAGLIFGSRTDATELRRLLQRVAHGPLATALSRGEDAAVLVAALRDEAQRALAALDETFRALARLMPQPERRGFEDRRRITEAVRSGDEWLAVELAAERLRDGLLAAADVAARLVARATDASLAEAGADMAAGQRALREAAGGLERAVHSPRTGDICWLALQEGGAVVLQSAPAHAGSLISRAVVDPRASAIFTSATLAVGGSFAFALDRFGLGDRAPALQLGSPFDYPRQALLVLPTDLLDPYEAGFVDQVADCVVDVALALAGRTLVLFTAHTMLRAVHARVAPRLEAHGLLTLGQGTGGSRRSLLEQFVAGDAVLLGTASFWEGVDLPGDVMRCVAIAKLPFPVPDDPVVAGRAEHYEDPFREYHVPVAALRLKQGFGRLIRTRADRGAIVLLDRRVSVRAYGDTLLSALPSCAVARPASRDIGATVAAWCAAPP